MWYWLKPCFLLPHRSTGNLIHWLSQSTTTPCELSRNPIRSMAMVSRTIPQLHLPFSWGVLHSSHTPFHPSAPFRFPSASRFLFITLFASDWLSSFAHRACAFDHSLWPAGINTSAPGTIEWSGGLINWNDPDYTSAGTVTPIFFFLVRHIQTHTIITSLHALLSWFIGSPSLLYCSVRVSVPLVVLFACLLGTRPFNESILIFN